MKTESKSKKGQRPSPVGRAASGSGADLIAKERRRQIEELGWDAANDDANDEREMLLGANAYIQSAISPNRNPDATRKFILGMYWPKRWDAKWFKPTTEVRNLVKAGALIAAEIDRLQRLEARGS